mmetsp:Transcript_27930/g.74180  ORF Transcript_27930/g.74180 Transcript_27930/m.74180 type:complete len:140 (+) Transcript_27930:1159-1578(+)
MVLTFSKCLISQPGVHHQHEHAANGRPMQQQGWSNTEQHVRSPLTQHSQQTGSQSRHPAKGMDMEGLTKQLQVQQVKQQPVHFMGNPHLHQRQPPLPLRSMRASWFPSLSCRPSWRTGFDRKSSQQVKHRLKQRIVRAT